MAIAFLHESYEKMKYWQMLSQGLRPAPEDFSRWHDEAEGRIGVLSHEEDRLRQVSTAADAAEKRRSTIEAQITRLRELLR